MGYYIRTPNTSFAIRTENLPRFFDLVSNLMSDENIEENGQGGSWSGGVKRQGWYSWVSTDKVRRAVLDRDIHAVFEEWGYDLEITVEYDGVTNFFLDIRGGEAKIGDEETFFAAIAPVVEDGSFLDVKGEDDEEWRWMWENGKFYSQEVIRKEIIFGEPNQIVFQDAKKNKETA
ncbi:MAG: hypothetical protein ACO4AM_07520 [Candidatus Nanopelagicaceae bacterium]